jgi:hypothetical protein
MVLAFASKHAFPWVDKVWPKVAEAEGEYKHERQAKHLANGRSCPAAARFHGALAVISRSRRLAKGQLAHPELAQESSCCASP